MVFVETEIIQAARAYMEERKNRKITLNEFLSDKSFPRHHIHLACSALKPEWQNVARKFRETGQTPEHLNTVWYQKVFQQALTIYDDSLNETSGNAAGDETSAPPSATSTAPTSTPEEEEEAANETVGQQLVQEEEEATTLETETARNLPDLNEMKATLLSMATYVGEISKLITKESEEKQRIFKEKNKLETKSKEKIESLGKENFALQAHFEEVSQNLDEENKELEAKLENERTSIKLLKQEKKRLSDQLSENTKEIQSLQTKCKTNKRLKLDNEELKSKISTASAELSNVAKASKELMEENMLLKEKLREATLTNQQAKARNHFFATKAQNEKRKRKQLKQQLLELRKLGAAEAQIKQHTEWEWSPHVANNKSEDPTKAEERMYYDIDI